MGAHRFQALRLCAATRWDGSFMDLVAGLVLTTTLAPVASPNWALLACSDHSLRHGLLALGD